MTEPLGPPRWPTDRTLQQVLHVAFKNGIRFQPNGVLKPFGFKSFVQFRDGEGRIPPESVKSMQAIGAWMKVNGEAIYGTTASPFAALDWGRCTRKGTTLYLHVFNWPQDGTLLIPLRNQASSARLLADPSQPLPVSVSADGIRIRLPASAPDAIAAVVALQITGEPDVIAAASSGTPEH